MKYGEDESGAKAKNAMRTLRNFGYSNSGEMVKYDITSILSDLKTGYPVLCSGYSHKVDYKFLGWTIASSLRHGHMWVLHGLLERKRTYTAHDTDGSVMYTGTESIYYPLCNWGWGGLDDGYYLSGVFDACNGADYGDYESSTRSDDGEAEGDTAHYYKYGIEVIKGIRR